MPSNAGVTMQRVRVTVTAISDIPVSWSGKNRSNLLFRIIVYYLC